MAGVRGDRFRRGSRIRARRGPERWFAFDNDLVDLTVDDHFAADHRAPTTIISAASIASGSSCDFCDWVRCIPPRQAAGGWDSGKRPSPYHRRPALISAKGPVSPQKGGRPVGVVPCGSAPASIFHRLNPGDFTCGARAYPCEMSRQSNESYRSLERVCRQQAAISTTPAAREELERMAEQYKRLADWVERQSAGNE